MATPLPPSTGIKPGVLLDLNLFDKSKITGCSTPLKIVHTDNASPSDVTILTTCGTPSSAQKEKIACCSICLDKIKTFVSHKKEQLEEKLRQTQATEKDSYEHIQKLTDSLNKKLLALQSQLEANNQDLTEEEKEELENVKELYDDLEMAAEETKELSTEVKQLEALLFAEKINVQTISDAQFLLERAKASASTKETIEALLEKVRITLNNK